MDKKIKEVLKYAVMAPSGDNSQPWHFVISDTIVKIYNLPDKDNPYLNFKQSGSFIAHGALLKNLEIASSAFGLKIEIKLFPIKDDLNLVSAVSFKDTTFEKINPLFKFISERATNRHFYKEKEFPVEDLNFLENIDKHDQIELHFITKREDRERAGLAGSSAEIVILENSLLHKYLFKDVMWSKKQENREKHGLYIKTMEFNPIQRLLFRLASNRILMNLAVKIRLPYFIAKQDAILYSSGSAIGLLTLKSISPENFVKVGMEMQEIWLKATSLGLAFQPISAILFLGFKMLNDSSDNVLNQKHKDIISKSYKDIFSVFNLDKNETPFMMFRIGYAKAPSAHSSRKEPIIENR